MTELFVLDRDENPHPVLLVKALQYRRAARVHEGDSILGALWLGYREAMCDATGLPSLDIEAWMDGHELDFPVPSVVDVPVAIGRCEVRLA
jgi:hypothetical protein